MANHVPTYKVWHAMIQRCSSKLHKSYKDYGGRGISVDPRWLRFENFVEDMGLKPPNLTLERKDNNGNYCKANCKWASTKEQSNNKRSNVVIKYEGKALNVTQWAEYLGIDRQVIYQRIRRFGLFKPALLLTTKDTRLRLITLEGRKVSISEAARITGIHRGTLQKRVEVSGDNPAEIYRGTPYAKLNH